MDLGVIELQRIELQRSTRRGYGWLAYFFRYRVVHVAKYSERKVDLPDIHDMKSLIPTEPKW